MQPVTLGEFFRLAGAHLRAAAVPDENPGPASVAASLDQAARLTRALSRYLDDVLAGSEAAVVLNMNPGNLLHSAAHARLALRGAAESLARAAASAGPPGPPRDGMAAQLAQAADCLVAGRDLLRSHFATGQTGLVSPLSRWAAVINSEPVNGALLDFIAQTSAQAGHWSSGVIHQVAGNSGSPQIVGAEAEKACRWLDLAVSFATAPHRMAPVSPAHRSLLQTIPDRSVPDRQPLTPGEPVSALCDGLAVSADRVRAWAYRQPSELPWRTGLTAESWRWTATAAAIACDLTEAIVVSLRTRAKALLIYNTPTGRVLDRIGRRAHEARDSWRSTAAAWKYMTTETRGLTSPVISDVSDLVMRLGRIAFDDPQWAPARARDAALRDPASLAPGTDDIADVVAAVHQITDALAALAVADQRSVAYAARNRGLYTPASAMPERLTRQARHYWHSPDDDRLTLRSAYSETVRVSRHLARALDVAAYRFRAPSQALAAMRALVPDPNGRPPSPIPVIQSSTTGWVPPRDSIETVIRELRVYDPALLLRAKAIDEAARRVMADAWAASGTIGAKMQAGIVLKGIPSARMAAALAGQSFPPITAHGPKPPEPEQSASSSPPAMKSRTSANLPSQTKRSAS